MFIFEKSHRNVMHYIIKINLLTLYAFYRLTVEEAYMYNNKHTR